MTNEEKILSALDTLQSDVSSMKSTMATKSDLAASEQRLRSEMATKSDIAAVRSEMVAGFTSVRSEMVTGFVDVRSEMATKSELAEMKGELFAVKKLAQEVQGEQVSMFEFLKENVATKRDLEEAKSEMMTHVDGLAAHNQKFDQELLMLRNRQNRLEARMA